MRISSLRDVLFLIGVLLLLFCQVPASHAQDGIPRVVQNYVLPGEIVQSIPPIHYKGSQYRVYLVSDTSLDDPFGKNLYSYGRDTLRERGVQAVLVTRNDRMVKDEETIRNILLLARTSYMLHRTDLPDEVARIDDALVEQVESLRKDPLFIAAFLEQNLLSLFQSEKDQYAEAVRGILTAQGPEAKQGDEFAQQVTDIVDTEGSVVDAIDLTANLAKYSNDRQIRELAKASRKGLEEWEKVSQGGVVAMKTSLGPIEFTNGLEIVGLTVRMIWLADLQKERSDWLSVYLDHFRSGDAVPDTDQYKAISAVQSEVESDWKQREAIAVDFVKEKGASLFVQLGTDVLAKQWVQFAWKKWGKRTAGHLAAGAASQVLLGFTLANLLYGMDDIFDNFMTADRSSELWQRFRAGRLDLQARDWADNPEQYDGDLAEAYRMAYLLEGFSACQFFRSYADGVASSRAIRALADLFTGGEWTEAIDGMRGLADRYESDIESKLGHPDLIDAAVGLALGRLEAMSPGRLGASQVRWPSPLILQVGQSGELAFELQNTGDVNWQPGQDYGLVCTRCERLGLSTFQPLVREIPVGRIASWAIPVMAPSTPGMTWLRYQIAYREEPFGNTVVVAVLVLPQGQSGLDLATLLREWLNQPVERARERWEQYRQELERRAQERLQREMERLVTDLLRSIQQQLCGTALILPLVLVVGMSTAVRARRRRGRRHERR